MSIFSYELPDASDFLWNLRRYLEVIGEMKIAGYLENCICTMSSSGFYSGRGNDHHDCALFLSVPLEILPLLTDEIQETIVVAADKVMPAEAGFDITTFSVSAKLEPPARPEQGLNASVFKYPNSNIIEFDGLRFRSPREVEIYKILKNRRVLFFPNPAAVFGQAGRRREPDFLICQNGKWGVLEINGKAYHQNAAQDHQRLGEFEDYGLSYVRFYDANDDPVETVDQFLERLARS